MNSPGCLAALMLFFLFVLPFFYAQVMVTAMERLGLPPGLGLFLLLGIILGGMVNIPVKRVPQEREVPVHLFHLFGLSRFFPVRRFRTYTIVAVNLGGCIIPCLIAFLQLGRIASQGPFTLLATLLVTGINVGVCYRLARPVPGLGITMPALIPPLVAALGALLLAPHFPTPVAFVAGVFGPLIGADLLHLREIEQTGADMASIGGAGTFDGIVLSGILAAVLA